MTDIVEKLRLRRDPLTDGERAEAADEIEQLREAVVHFKNSVAEQNKNIMRQHEKIVRLRKLLRECHEHDLTGTDPDVWSRVQEALGDE